MAKSKSKSKPETETKDGVTWIGGPIDDKIAPPRAELEAIYAAIIANSGGRCRLAHQEADESPTPDAGASTFLKLDEKRLGRDLQLYLLMAKATGRPDTFVRFLEEVVLPLQRGCPPAWLPAMAACNTQARTIFTAELLTDWTDLYHSLVGDTSEVVGGATA